MDRRKNGKCFNDFGSRNGKMKRILVTVPNQHWIHKTVTQKLLMLMLDGRYSLKIEMPSHKPYENNLHHIVTDFVNGDYDFWLSMDADNPPTQNPLNLVELDLDIIGLPTPIWHYTNQAGERPVYWNAYDYVEDKDAYSEHNPKDGLQKVDAIGTGCFLIARRVFDNPHLLKGAFTRKLYPDGTVNKGNDISFCERARECGFQIHTHYDFPCMHFSELELNETVTAFRQLYEVN